MKVILSYHKVYICLCQTVVNSKAPQHLKCITTINNQYFQKVTLLYSEETDLLVKLFCHKNKEIKSPTMLSFYFIKHKNSVKQKQNKPSFY